MIREEELDTTSLVVLMKEMSQTNELLDYIDTILKDKELTDYERKCYISVLNDFERYYLSLEEQIKTRGFMKQDDTLRKALK